MKAALCTAYGKPEVVVYGDIEKPVPKKNEVLIRIKAGSVSSGDARMRSLDLPIPGVFKLIYRMVVGFNRPKKPILGSQYAGVIESLGQGVTKYKPGDEVFGITGMIFGCHAEYVCVKESSVITHKPENLSFEEAAPISFGAMTALHLLRKANVQKGDKVLIYGASGSVGTYGVQIAKNLGAEVTALCSPRNFDLVSSLGADYLLDYHTVDLSTIRSQYHVIFDAVGKIQKKKSQEALKPGGAYVSVSQLTSEKLDKLDYLRDMAKEGRLKTVIDRTFDLKDIVEAHRHVDTGRKVGNVILNIS